MKKGVDMFANMDDYQMESAMAFMQKAQQVKDRWTKTNEKVGGHLLKIVIVVIILALLGLYQGISWYRALPSAKESSLATDVEPTVPKAVEMDEFDTDSEF